MYKEHVKKPWLIAIFPGVLIIIALVFVIGLLLIKLLWSWTIPDLFPGAVSDGLIASSISWYTSLKLAIFLAVLAGIAGARHHRDECHCCLDKNMDKEAHDKMIKKMGISDEEHKNWHEKNKK